MTQPYTIATQCKGYTVQKLYNYVVIIRQRKRYNIYKQRSQSEHHSSMYSSNAVGRRRIRTGVLGLSVPPGLAVLVQPREGLSSRVWGVQSICFRLRVGRDSRVCFWNGWRWCFAQEQTVHMNGLSCALGCMLDYYHQWRLEGFDAPRSGP